MKFEDIPAETAYIRFYLSIEQPQMEFLASACDRAVADGKKAIYLAFSSSGGTSDVGVALYEHLRNYRVPIITHNLGNVNSAAILLFLSGALRLANPNAIFRFHRVFIPCSTGMEVTHPDALRVASQLLIEERRLTRIYDDAGVKGGAELMHDDTFVDTPEALARNVVHDVRYTAPPASWRWYFVAPG